jgi:hypothetical protein
MTDTVTKLKIVNKAFHKPGTSRSFQKKLKRQAMAGTAIGAVAIVLTGLSLDHLATGIGIVTNTAGWQNWAMSIAIDLGFITLELAQLSATTEKVSKAIARFTKPAIIGTMVGSATMNAFAFAAQTSGYMVGPAIVLGLAIPAMIYSLTRVGAALYVDCDSKR